MKEIINTELIRNYMEQNGFSKTAFCKKCKISPQSLTKVLAGNLNVDIKILFKIAFAMDLHIKEMFVKV